MPEPLKKKIWSILLAVAGASAIVALLVFVLLKASCSPKDVLWDQLDASIPTLAEIQEQEIIMLYQHANELSDQLLNCKGISP